MTIKPTTFRPSESSADARVWLALAVLDMARMGQLPESITRKALALAEAELRERTGTPLEGCARRTVEEIRRHLEELCDA